MYTNLKEITYDLYSDETRSFYDLDNTDRKHCIAAYLNDNEYDIQDIIECCLIEEFNSHIIKEFNDYYNVDLNEMIESGKEYRYSEKYSRYTNEEAKAVITQEFINFVVDFSGSLDSKFKETFLELLIKEVDASFDEHIYAHLEEDRLFAYA
jgi:hypothetical protein